MSFGASNKSKYGGDSELTDGLSNVSGEVAATEASLDKKGSFGFKGGIGILALVLAFMEQRVLQFLRFLSLTEEDEDGSEVEMGICKLMAILFSIFPLQILGFFSKLIVDENQVCGAWFCFTETWLPYSA